MEVDPAFLAFLKGEEERAYDGNLLEEVEAAIKSYNGDEYGDEEDGRSQVVARDVSESVDYMLTSIMDVIAGSGRIVEFEPTDEDQEDLADDATEALHYIYRRKSGYRFIHDWAKSGLMEKIGVAKTCVEQKRKRVEHLVPDAMIPDHAIEAEETDQFDDFGNQMFRVVTLEDTAATFPDYQVPLEEFRFSSNSWDFDENIYLAHLPRKTLSDLVEMGFDPDVVADLQGETGRDTLAAARDEGRSSWHWASDRTGALREVTLCEEYVLYDLNGDGIAERLCVHRVGDTILNIEEVDEQPFEYWCPYPMQGRVVGQSFADKTMDIQRVNTVLERNMLDSLYQQTAPGTFISEDAIGDHTLDDLLTIRPGRVVRFTGATPPIPEIRQDVSAAAMAAIEFKIRQRESRTGITRLNKGVDEDTLNDTAKGQAQLMSRGQQMERYIIRNFAEGVARLFMRKVALLRKYGQPFRIRVDGQYREVDPSQWPEDMEVQVKVGLGSGSKEDRIMYRNMVAQSHTLLMQAGSPICTWENVYNNLTAAAKDAGLAPNDIFTELPRDEQGNVVEPEQPPDPAVMEAQAKLQIEQAKAQSAAQLAAAEAEHKAQLGAQEQQRKLEETFAKHQLEQFKANAKAMQDQQRAEFEARLALMELQFEQKLAAKKQADDHELKKNRPGGDLSK